MGIYSMLRRGNSYGRQAGGRNQAPAGKTRAVADSGGASTNDATRLLSDVSARQFWEKYFGNDKEVDFSFFWECLCDEYAAVLGEHADKEHENIFRSLLDSNQNDKVSILE